MAMKMQTTDTTDNLTAEMVNLSVTPTVPQPRQIQSAPYGMYNPIILSLEDNDSGNEELMAVLAGTSVAMEQYTQLLQTYFSD